MMVVPCLNLCLNRERERERESGVSDVTRTFLGVQESAAKYTPLGGTDLMLA
jgi:hypothetical protein